MNKNQLAGCWNEIKGKLKEKWGKVTDDDLLVIDGKREQVAGILQQRYGYAREKAEEEFDKFLKELKF